MAGKRGKHRITEARVHRWVILLLRFILAAIFIYAGVLKVANPARFAVDIDNYHILPWLFAVRLAFYLPWLEIVCGLALLFGRMETGALVMLLGLLCIFLAATISAKARGIDITCGCFGSAGQNLGFVRHLAIDLLLLAGAGFLLWSRGRLLCLTDSDRS